MSNPTLIITLAIATLVIVIGYLAYQAFSVKRARDEHHHSAVTKGKPELRDG